MFSWFKLRGCDPYGQAAWWAFDVVLWFKSHWSDGCSQVVCEGSKWSSGLFSWVQSSDLMWSNSCDCVV